MLTLKQFLIEDENIENEVNEEFERVYFENLTEDLGTALLAVGALYTGYKAIKYAWQKRAHEKLMRDANDAQFSNDHKRIKKLLKHNNHAIRHLLVYNHNIQKKHVDKLLNDKSSIVRNAMKTHYHKWLKHVAKQHDSINKYKKTTQEEPINQPKKKERIEPTFGDEFKPKEPPKETPKEEPKKKSGFDINKAIDEADTPRKLKKIITHPKLSPTHIHKLLDKSENNGHLLSMISHRNDLNTSHLHKLNRSHHMLSDDAFYNIVQHKSYNTQHIEHIISHGNRRSHMLAAFHPLTTKTQLKTLTKSPHIGVAEKAKSRLKEEYNE